VTANLPAKWEKSTLFFSYWTVRGGEAILAGQYKKNLNPDFKFYCTGIDSEERRMGRNTKKEKEKKEKREGKPRHLFVCLFVCFVFFLPPHTANNESSRHMPPSGSEGWFPHDKVIHLDNERRKKKEDESVQNLNTKITV